MQLNKSFRRVDTWIVLSALLYVILPILIFLLKFTRPTVWIIGLVLFAFFIYRMVRLFFIEENIPGVNKGFDNIEIFNKKFLIYFIVTSLIFIVWIFFSGIGSFSFQNWDHWVRNPIYNDIINKPWPIYYNLEMQAESVRNLIGGEWVAFAYYFTYWLTPAALCKAFGFIGGGLASRLILFMYTLAGIIIINYLLCRLFRKFSYKITVLFMLFSGLDVLAYLIQNHKLPALTAELEWSLLHYQLSGNTTQLYYVFNQSIPIWILMLLILNFSVPSVMAGMASLCFAYSPWATIGLVPITLVGMIKSAKSSDKSPATLGKIILKCVSIANILIPLFLLIVYGLYYTASGGSQGGKGLYYFTTEATLPQYIFGFIIFVLTEFGLYYIAMGKNSLKYRYSVVVFIELLLFPLFYVVDFNFFIRGTIPALFILMVICISYALKLEASNMDVSFSDGELISNLPSNMDVSIRASMSVRRKILTVLLVIGALNSIVAFTRSAIYTAEGGDYLQSDIVTFDDMSTANEYQVLTTNSQFFVHGFATKPFYLYVSKIGQ